MAGAQTQFKDVPANAPYAAAVDLLVKLGVVTGVAPDRFAPDDLLTREQFAAFVVRAMGRERLARAFANQPTTFRDDAQISSWARGYVVLASSMKVIQGFPDGTFRPREEVTYAQALTMLVRALGFDAHARNLGGWPGGYLVVADDLDLTEKLGAFDADLPMTRADMAIVTYNTVVSNYKADDQGRPTQTGCNNTGDEGACSLLRRAFGYTADQYKSVAVPIRTVSGTFKSYLSLSNRINVDGTLYDLATGVTVTLNEEATTLSSTFPADGDKVTLTLNAEGKVTKIAVTRTTFNNVQLTGVTLSPGSTEDGKITVAGATYAINVNRDTKVTVDGQAGKLSDVDAALKALRNSYPGKNALAVIVTRGNNNASASEATALSLTVITKNTVAGKVTAAGTDSGGSYVRILPSGATSDVKVYYTGLTVGSGGDFNVGDTVTLLKGSDDKARVVLNIAPTTATSVAWAHALSVEYTTVGATTYLVNVNAHTAKMDQPVTRVYAGKQDSSGNYTTVINTTYVKANNVVALRIVNDRVELAWGYNDPAGFPAFSGDNGSLNFRTGDPSSVSAVSGVYVIAFTGPDINIIAGSDVVILKSDGTHSALRLADLTGSNRTKIGAVFYVTKDGVHTAQVILLDVNE